METDAARLRERITVLEARLAGREAELALCRDADPSRSTTIESLLRNRCEAINDLAGELEGCDEKTIMQRSLQTAEELTGSTISFTHFINDDEKTIELATWSKRTLHEYCSAAFDKHYPIEKAGIWADAIRKHRSVVFNDYAGYSRKCGLPEGHAHLERLISVPVFDDGRIVVLTGVGNKPEDYTDVDAQTVQLVSSQMWRQIKHRRARTHLQTLYEAAPVGIGLLINRTFIDVNPFFCHMLGYMREELIGQATRMIYASDSEYDRVGAVLYPQLQQSGRGRLEFGLLSKDGTPLRVLASAQVINPEKPEHGIVFTLLDITERRRMEIELEKHQNHLQLLVEKRTMELEKAKLAEQVAQRARSTFLANMSHETRTPMNAVIGLAHLLEDRELEPDIKEKIRQIEGAGRRLLAIINDILDIASIESGELELHECRFKPKKVLKKVRDMMEDAAGKKGIRIELDAGDLPKRLEGDSSRLVQALLNYTSNAVKFSDGGIVRIRSMIAAEDGENILARFEVSDEGIGIETQKLPGLFQAFRQGDASLSRQFGGAGLGLAITRHLAELMGGDVGVESAPGEGSTFWFTARLNRLANNCESDGAEAKLDACSILASRYSNTWVLLAEDDMVNREVALALLNRAGLCVDTALNGEEAVKRASSRQYDLVLMDVQMPVMDGLEATRIIRTMENYREIPILALSANVLGDDRRACKEAGMSGFISKPVDPKTLYRIILDWLGKQLTPA